MIKKESKNLTTCHKKDILIIMTREFLEKSKNSKCLDEKK